MMPTIDEDTITNITREEFEKVRAAIESGEVEWVEPVVKTGRGVFNWAGNRYEAYTYFGEFTNIYLTKWKY